MTGKQDILADLVRLIHYIVLVFVFVPWFANDFMLLRICSILLGYIFLKWTFVDDGCSLTFIENKLRGIKNENGFVYRLLNPIINVNESVFYKNAYYFIILSLLVSIYKLLSL